MLTGVTASLATVHKRDILSAKSPAFGDIGAIVVEREYVLAKPQRVLNLTANCLFPSIEDPAREKAARGEGMVFFNFFLRIVVVVVVGGVVCACLWRREGVVLLWVHMGVH